ncbi:hypothetical protein ADUPG1_010831, partial [Aduncisulcus paluster]
RILLAVATWVSQCASGCGSVGCKSSSSCRISQADCDGMGTCGEKGKREGRKGLLPLTDPYSVTAFASRLPSDIKDWVWSREKELLDSLHASCQDSPHDHIPVAHIAPFLSFHDEQKYLFLVAKTMPVRIGMCTMLRRLEKEKSLEKERKRGRKGHKSHHGRKSSSSHKVSIANILSDLLLSLTSHRLPVKHVCEVIVVGSVGCGKSTLISRVIGERKERERKERDKQGYSRNLVASQPQSSNSSSIEGDSQPQMFSKPVWKAGLCVAGRWMKTEGGEGSMKTNGPSSDSSNGRVQDKRKSSSNQKGYTSSISKRTNSVSSSTSFVNAHSIDDTIGAPSESSRDDDFNGNADKEDVFSDVVSMCSLDGVDQEQFPRRTREGWKGGSKSTRRASSSSSKDHGDYGSRYSRHSSSHKSSSSKSEHHHHRGKHGRSSHDKSKGVQNQVPPKHSSDFLTPPLLVTPPVIWLIELYKSFKHREEHWNSIRMTHLPSHFMNIPVDTSIGVFDMPPSAISSSLIRVIEELEESEVETFKTLVFREEVQSERNIFLFGRVEEGKLREKKQSLAEKKKFDLEESERRERELAGMEGNVSAESRTQRGIKIPTISLEQKAMTWGFSISSPSLSSSLHGNRKRDNKNGQEDIPIPTSPRDIQPDYAIGSVLLRILLNTIHTCEGIFYTIDTIRMFRLPSNTLLHTLPHTPSHLLPAPHVSVIPTLTPTREVLSLCVCGEFERWLGVTDTPGMVFIGCDPSKQHKLAMDHFSPGI